MQIEYIASRLVALLLIQLSYRGPNNDKTAYEEEVASLFFVLYDPLLFAEYLPHLVSCPTYR